MIDDILGLIGLSRKPNLSPIDALTDDDLERMHFSAMQSGDNERASRILVIKKMRQQQEPLLTEAMRSSNQQQPPRPQSFGGQLNPMNRINDALTGQQQ
jgi:hypothetical protein